mgnify:CR=1 FL=1
MTVTLTGCRRHCQCQVRQHGGDRAHGKASTLRGAVEEV